MAKVKLLSKETSELIAAGEVIERPCSVIKELVENAIDSGADNITVEIKNGGISYIRVTDNGCGMDSEDVRTAFLRHATSKISDKEDLNNIYTLGFRGEALASICAVAKVDVLTKTKGSFYGTHYAIEGTDEKAYEQTGCPEGTTIIIRDIFFNVPARLKFLKKDIVEGNAIADITNKIAMSHPEISFKFIRDNRQDFLTPGDGELYSSVYAIMGKQFAASMIPVDYELNGIKIDGFTVKPIFGRPKRSFQYFFINGRYVKTYTCTAALEEAYRNCIMEGKFPACVLRLTVTPDMLDVNVHPAKTDVRFTDDRVIHESVFFAVKNAILLDSKPIDIQIKRSVPDYTKTTEMKPAISGTQMAFRSDIRTSEKKNIATSVQPSAKHEVNAFSDAIIPSEKSVMTSVKTENIDVKKYIEQAKSVKIDVEFAHPEDDRKQTEIPYNIEVSEKDDIPLDIIKPEKIRSDFKYIGEMNEANADNCLSEESDKEVFFRIIGEAFKTYIVTEVDDNIIFVDKHAAHERILFEKLKSGQQQLQCQMMLDPIEVMLPYSDFDALILNKDTAFELGFSFEIKGKQSVEVNGIPSILDGCNVSDLVIELAHNFSKNQKNPLPEILDDMYHSFACKAAIKAHDKNDITELSSIVKTLLENENIRYCPHGRPVMFSLSKYELEKQFKRIV